ncbi:uncharacterized protein LOC141910678 [Tubulanus polymorphus]|uniref:uncharacterized protein LOC141910678 n=1 Tax=Tubulanus polymorphus TaxID=672921 RepID=UPI003DA6936E
MASEYFVGKEPPSLPKSDKKKRRKEKKSKKESNTLPEDGTTTTPRNQNISIDDHGKTDACIDAKGIVIADTKHDSESNPQQVDKFEKTEQVKEISTLHSPRVIRTDTSSIEKIKTSIELTSSTETTATTSKNISLSEMEPDKEALTDRRIENIFIDSIDSNSIVTNIYNETVTIIGMMDNGAPVEVGDKLKAPTISALLLDTLPPDGPKDDSCVGDQSSEGTFHWVCDKTRRGTDDEEKQVPPIPVPLDYTDDINVTIDRTERRIVTTILDQLVITTGTKISRTSAELESEIGVERGESWLEMDGRALIHFPCESEPGELVAASEDTVEDVEIRNVQNKPVDSREDDGKVASGDDPSDTKDVPGQIPDESPTEFTDSDVIKFRQIETGKILVTYSYSIITTGTRIIYSDVTVNNEICAERGEYFIEADARPSIQFSEEPNMIEIDEETLGEPEIIAKVASNLNLTEKTTVVGTNDASLREPDEEKGNVIDNEPFLSTHAEINPGTIAREIAVVKPDDQALEAPLLTKKKRKQKRQERQKSHRTPNSKPNEGKYIPHSKNDCDPGLSTEQPKQPTEDVPQPTEGVSQPTEDVSQPTKDRPQPTGDVSQPTEDVPLFTEDVPQPAEDILQPTEEESQNTDDVSHPTEDASKPNEDVLELNEDAQKPTVDVSKPTEDISQPTEDVSLPTEDILQPTEGVSQPIEDISQPTEDILQPTEDVPQPAEDVPLHTEDILQPMGDVALPNEDVSQPNEDISQPTEDVPQPTEYLSQPNEDVSHPNEDVLQHNEDISQPTGDVSQSTEDISQSTENVSKSTENVQLGKKSKKKKRKSHGKKGKPLKPMDSSGVRPEEKSSADDPQPIANTLDIITKISSFSHNVDLAAQEGINREPEGLSISAISTEPDRVHQSGLKHFTDEAGRTLQQAVDNISLDYLTSTGTQQFISSTVSYSATIESQNVLESPVDGVKDTKISISDSLAEFDDQDGGDPESRDYSNLIPNKTSTTYVDCTDTRTIMFPSDYLVFIPGTIVSYKEVVNDSHADTERGETCLIFDGRPLIDSTERSGTLAARSDVDARHNFPTQSDTTLADREDVDEGRDTRTKQNVDKIPVDTKISQQFVPSTLSYSASIEGANVLEAPDDEAKDAHTSTSAIVVDVVALDQGGDHRAMTKGSAVVKLDAGDPEIKHNLTHKPDKVSTVDGDLTDTRPIRILSDCLVINTGTCISFKEAVIDSKVDSERGESWIKVTGRHFINSSNQSDIAVSDRDLEKRQDIPTQPNTTVAATGDMKEGQDIRTELTEVKTNIPETMVNHPEEVYPTETVLYMATEDGGVKEPSKESPSTKPEQGRKTKKGRKHEKSQPREKPDDSGDKRKSSTDRVDTFSEVPMMSTKEDTSSKHGEKSRKKTKSRKGKKNEPATSCVEVTSMGPDSITIVASTVFTNLSEELEQQQLTSDDYQSTTGYQKDSDLQVNKRDRTTDKSATSTIGDTQIGDRDQTSRDQTIDKSSELTPEDTRTDDRDRTYPDQTTDESTELTSEENQTDHRDQTSRDQITYRSTELTLKDTRTEDRDQTSPDQTTDKSTKLTPEDTQIEDQDQTSRDQTTDKSIELTPGDTQTENREQTSRDQTTDKSIKTTPGDTQTEDRDQTSRDQTTDKPIKLTPEDTQTEDQYQTSRDQTTDKSIELTPGDTQTENREQTSRDQTTDKSIKTTPGDTQTEDRDQTSRDQTTDKPIKLTPEDTQTEDQYQTSRDQTTDKSIELTPGDTQTEDREQTSRDQTTDKSIKLTRGDTQTEDRDQTYPDQTTKISIVLTPEDTQTEDRDQTSRDQTTDKSTELTPEDIQTDDRDQTSRDQITYRSTELALKDTRTEYRDQTSPDQTTDKSTKLRPEDTQTEDQDQTSRDQTTDKSIELTPGDTQTEDRDQTSRDQTTDKSIELTPGDTQTGDRDQTYPDQTTKISIVLTPEDTQTEDRDQTSRDQTSDKSIKLTPGDTQTEDRDQTSRDQTTDKSTELTPKETDTGNTNEYAVNIEYLGDNNSVIIAPILTDDSSLITGVINDKKYTTLEDGNQMEDSSGDCEMVSPPDVLDQPDDDTLASGEVHSESCVVRENAHHGVANSEIVCLVNDPEVVPRNVSSKGNDINSVTSEEGFTEVQEVWENTQPSDRNPGTVSEDKDSESEPQKEDFTEASEASPADKDPEPINQDIPGKDSIGQMTSEISLTDVSKELNNRPPNYPESVNLEIPGKVDDDDNVTSEGGFMKTLGVWENENKQPAEKNVKGETGPDTDTGPQTETGPETETGPRPTRRIRFDDELITSEAGFYETRHVLVRKPVDEEVSDEETDELDPAAARELWEKRRHELLKASDAVRQKGDAFSTRRMKTKSEGYDETREREYWIRTEIWSNPDMSENDKLEAMRRISLSGRFLDTDEWSRVSEMRSPDPFKSDVTSFDQAIAERNTGTFRCVPRDEDAAAAGSGVHDQSVEEYGGGEMDDEERRKLEEYYRVSSGFSSRGRGTYKSNVRRHSLATVEKWTMSLDGSMHRNYAVNALNGISAINPGQFNIAQQSTFYDDSDSDDDLADIGLAAPKSNRRPSRSLEEWCHSLQRRLSLAAIGGKRMERDVVAGGGRRRWSMVAKGAHTGVPSRRMSDIPDIQYGASEEDETKLTGDEYESDTGETKIFSDFYQDQKQIQLATLTAGSALDAARAEQESEQESGSAAADESEEGWTSTETEYYSVMEVEQKFVISGVVDPRVPAGEPNDIISLDKAREENIVCCDRGVYMNPLDGSTIPLLEAMNEGLIHVDVVYENQS